MQPSPTTDPVGSRRSAWWPLFALGVLATGLLFWNLGQRYLWQDEAACAVLAERLFEHGRPLSYDGTNLITMDEYRVEEKASLHQRTGSPEGAVEYYKAKGDFKADTSWIGQPWGQFVFAGLGMELFGRGTAAARAPFALAGVLTVLALYQFVRKRFRDPWMALLTVLLLLGNVFWFLHVRQCRYYSTATLFLLLTLVAYLRWQDGARGGALLFVASAWCWFQNDFGSVWPVFGVFTVDALRATRPRHWWKPLLVLALLAASIAPFLFYYEMFGRVKQSFNPWDVKFFRTLFNMNQYQLPLLILAPLGWLAWRGRLERAGGEARVIGLCVAIVFSMVIWMPTVGPDSFYRYVVDLTPLSCLLVAFTIVRLVQCADGIGTSRFSTRLLSALLVGGVLITSLTSLPGSRLMPSGYWPAMSLDDYGVRPEFAAAMLDLAGDAPDPNRAVVEYLYTRLEPGDEILVNYEDIPLMFYTDHPIRGGIPAFRVQDPEPEPARFAVIRRNVGFVHGEVFTEELQRHDWFITEVNGPDIPWGNNPDPLGHYSRWWGHWPGVAVFERTSGSAN